MTTKASWAVWLALGFVACSSKTSNESRPGSANGATGGSESAGFTSTGGSAGSTSTAGRAGSGMGGSNAGSGSPGGGAGSTSTGGIAGSGVGGGSSGMGPTCPNAPLPESFACAGTNEHDIACVPSPGGDRFTLQQSVDSVYVLDVGRGVILAVDKLAPDQVSVVDTGASRAITMLVADEYVYWSSGSGLSRTPLEAGAEPELLLQESFPLGLAAASDGSSLFWSTYAPPFQSVVLRLDESSTIPATTILLQSHGSTVFGAADGKIHSWDSSTLTTLDKNERCLCQSAGNAQRSPLDCVTADGIELPATGTAGSANYEAYYRDCGGLPPTITYRGDVGIEDPILDSEFIYFQAYTNIMRIDRDADADADEPLAPTSLFALGDQTSYPRFSFTSLSLDEDYVYAARRFDDSLTTHTDILRIAKDGSGVSTMVNLPDNWISNLMADEDHVYYVSRRNCAIALGRVAK